jgi:hypothetical protein
LRFEHRIAVRILSNALRCDLISVVVFRKAQAVVLVISPLEFSDYEPKCTRRVS